MIVYQFRMDCNNSGTNVQVLYDGIVLVDLTATFGAGNEPPNSWCDANIYYFEGTTRIPKQ